MTGHAVLLRARRSDLRLPTEAPRHPTVFAVDLEGRRRGGQGEPEEILDEAHEQLLQRVCAIDVAKDSGKGVPAGARRDRDGAPGQQGVGRASRHPSGH